MHFNQKKKKKGKKEVIFYGGSVCFFFFLENLKGIVLIVLHVRIAVKIGGVTCNRNFFFFFKWVLVSSISKVSDSCIRDLEFNSRLHQKLIFFFLRKNQKLIGVLV